MSLLLDALKKAAEQKSQKERAPETDVAQERTAYDLSTDVDAETEKTDVLKPEDTQIDDWTLDDVTHTDFSQSSIVPDTQFDETAAGVTAPGVSLTQNIEQEKVAFAASPEQAAYMFTSKAPDISAERKRKWILLSMVVMGVLVLAGLYGYEYLISINETSATAYRPIRPARPLQLEPATISESAMPTEMPEQDIDFLVEQEDYATLLNEALQDDGTKTQEVAAAPTKQVPAKQDKPAPAKSARTPRRDTAAQIRIAKQDTTPPLQILLQQAYTAYQRGDNDQAQQHYQQALMLESNNRDALLGLAALALKRQNVSEADRLYTKVLNMNPRDSYAIAGIAALRENQSGQADLNESRLKLLLDETPDAHELHFSLGNYYAGRENWPAAQQAYFNAYRLDSNSPDYLYNLAVSLDHLGQKKTALQYYQQALSALQSRAGHFDASYAERRVARLQDGFVE